MAVLADILLLIAALSAALYCRALALRLRRLGDTGKGLGGAIAALSVQVDDMKATLKGLQAESDRQVARLDATCSRADAAARRLELLLAALPDEGVGAAPPPPLRLTPAEMLRQTPGARDGAGGPAVQANSAGATLSAPHRESAEEAVQKRGPARRIFRNRAVGGVGVSA